jgi:hypothetical protein
MPTAAEIVAFLAPQIITPRSRTVNVERPRRRGAGRPRARRNGLSARRSSADKPGDGGSDRDRAAVTTIGSTPCAA